MTMTLDGGNWISISNILDQLVQKPTILLVLRWSDDTLALGLLIQLVSCWSDKVAAELHWSKILLKSWSKYDVPATFWPSPFEARPISKKRRIGECRQFGLRKMLSLRETVEQKAVNHSHAFWTIIRETQVRGCESFLRKFSLFCLYPMVTSSTSYQLRI